MDSALDVFKTMMRDQVAPELRRLGFKGSGQSFVLPSETHWALLGFQKFTSSNRAQVNFTVNVTVTGKRAWERTRGVHPYLPERPSANTYGQRQWEERIGELLPEGKGGDWSVSNETDANAVAAEVLDAIRTYVVPEMRRQMETPDPEVALSLGALSGGAQPSARSWSEAVRRVGTRIVEAGQGVQSPLNLNIAFQIPGDVLQPDFQGIRTGGYSAKERTLLVQVAVPDEADGDLDARVVSLVWDAIEVAEEWAAQRKVADTPFVTLRQLLGSL